MTNKIKTPLRNYNNSLNNIYYSLYYISENEKKGGLKWKIQ